jgi:hypothetical protein
LFLAWCFGLLSVIRTWVGSSVPTTEPWSGYKVCETIRGWQPEELWEWKRTELEQRGRGNLQLKANHEREVSWLDY